MLQRCSIPKTIIIIMNLVLSVIVDRAVQARDEDNNYKLHEKDRKTKEAARALSKVCKQMDTDKSGEYPPDIALEKSLSLIIIFTLST